MTELQTKQLALLEDTIKFFNSENRCTTEYGRCKYYLPEKEGCAIGRLIPDKELCRQLDKGVGDDLHSGIDKIAVFQLIPKELQEYGQKFLHRLQKLHDNENFWNSEGISSVGEIEIEIIKEIFNLN